MRHQLYLAAALAFGAFAPSLAWEHILNDYGNGQMLNAASAFDHTGSATLMFGCVMGSGSFHMQVLLTETSPVAQSTAELVFVIGGYPLHVSAVLGDAEGNLTASTSSDAMDTAEIARSVYLSSDPIELDILGQSLFFDGGNFSNEALGAVLDSCG